MKVVEELRSPFDFPLREPQDRPRTNGSVGPGRTGGLRTRLEAVGVSNGEETVGIRRC